MAKGDNEKGLNQRQRKVLIKDVTFLILLLHAGSYLMYTTVHTIVSDLHARKRWSSFDYHEFENEVRSLSGESLGRWKIKVQGHYLMLS